MEVVKKGYNFEIKADATNIEGHYINDNGNSTCVIALGVTCDTVKQKVKNYWRINSSATICGTIDDGKTAARCIQAVFDYHGKVIAEENRKLNENWID